jgi:phenylacetate-CoA ligase
MVEIDIPRTPAEVDERCRARITDGIAAAWRSPFFRRRLTDAGLAEGEVPTDDQWLRIQPTTKDELRALSPEEFRDQLVVASPDDISMYWRSGGVTGRPFFYPKAKADYDALAQGFIRVLGCAGITPDDLVHNSFPFMGVHPIGAMFTHVLRDHGVGQIFAGAGANTPSDVQVQLMFDLQPSAWIGIGSYINHLGHRAEALGFDLASSSIDKIVSSAEPLTPAKRSRMESRWGAELFDCYGMTECTMMGCEGPTHDGLHVWTDLFRLEILDPETWRPLPYGEQGAVVVTPFHHGIPFIRWMSGDLGTLEPGRAGGDPYDVFPRLRLGSRTVGFSKVKGVNINHNDLEDALLSIPELADYLVEVVTDDGYDLLRVHLEASTGIDGVVVTRRVEDHISHHFELRPVVELHARGTIAGWLEGQVKQVRFRDERSSA